jgi:ubiquinone/menaquinone biosynthesis C-methylase UbiE
MDHQEHYERLAPKFTQHWSYSPKFVAWMTGCLGTRLQLRADDRLVDAGCGTGIYAVRLADRARQVVCLDPSMTMLEHIPDDPRLIRTTGSAEQLANHYLLPGERFDAILLKEVIHLIDDRPAAINGLAQRLASGGRLLVAMLPPQIDYPLFPAALDRYNGGKLTPDHVATWMGDAGLHVTTSAEHHRVHFLTERYLTMVRDRYMSLLSKCTDTEIEDGIRHIRRQHPGPVIEFDDRFVLVLGTRTDADTNHEVAAQLIPS